MANLVAEKVGGSAKNGGLEAYALWPPLSNQGESFPAIAAKSFLKATLGATDSEHWGAESVQMDMVGGVELR